MHIEKMKYYMDLYECRSYTEAAKKNYISQASLSQYINLLEDTFQAQLFDRSVTPIEPTSAGTIFYEETKILWKQYHNMQVKMLEMQDHELQPLRLAYTSMVGIQAILPYIPAFKEQYPEADLQLTKVLIKDCKDYLLKNVCDVAISFASEFAGCKEITTTALVKGEYAALVPSTHPLFDHTSIAPEELYQYPLIMLSPESIGSTYEVMRERTLNDGYVPNIVKTVDDIETELFSIITDNLIGFAPDTYNLVDCEDHIHMIPIVNSNHKFQIEVGYLRSNKNPTLKLFLKHLQTNQ